MAHIVAFGSITALINPIREAALMYAQDNFIMPQLVTVYTGGGWANREFSEYTAGTIDTSVGETDDIAAGMLNRGSLSTLVPSEAGHMYPITDRRFEGDDVMSIMADAASDLGYGVFKHIEGTLAAQMASFTLGTIGTAGSTLTWKDVFKARALLSANAIPGPYNCVLHEYQYFELATEANIAGLSNAAPLRVRDEIQSSYYVGSFAGINFYTVGVAALAAGTAVLAGIFNRQAIGYDIRRPFRLETDRDASKRLTEVVASHGFAAGVIRPGWGVSLLGDASVPS